MHDVKRHGWKIAVLAILYGIVGQMDYEDALRIEAAQAKQTEPKQERERQYAALGDQQ